MVVGAALVATGCSRGGDGELTVEAPRQVVVPGVDGAATCGARTGELSDELDVVWALGQSDLVARPEAFQEVERAVGTQFEGVTQLVAEGVEVQAVGVPAPESQAPPIVVDRIATAPASVTAIVTDGDLENLEEPGALAFLGVTDVPTEAVVLAVVVADPSGQLVSIDGCASGGRMDELRSRAAAAGIDPSEIDLEAVREGSILERIAVSEESRRSDAARAAAPTLPGGVREVTPAGPLASGDLWVAVEIIFAEGVAPETALCFRQKGVQLACYPAFADDDDSPFVATLQLDGGQPMQFERVTFSDTGRLLRSDELLDVEDTSRLAGDMNQPKVAVYVGDETSSAAPRMELGPPPASSDARPASDDPASPPPTTGGPTG